ncbi:MAG: DUF305 domain-containing protein [Candidatus Woesearchaeota archaeon]
MRYAYLFVLVFLVGCVGVYETHEEAEHAVHDPHIHAVSSEQEFLVEMIPHHQEAVDTSQVIVDSSQNPSLVALAQGIIDEQVAEIAFMTSLLERYDAELVSSYRPMMGDLSLLRGNSLDVAYITGMIAHHQAAIVMARSVLELRPSEEVFVLANNIIESQTTEVFLLREFLSEYE